MDRYGTEPGNCENAGKQNETGSLSYFYSRALNADNGRSVKLGEGRKDSLALERHRPGPSPSRPKLAPPLLPGVQPCRGSTDTAYGQAISPVLDDVPRTNKPGQVRSRTGMVPQVSDAQQPSYRLIVLRRYSRRPGMAKSTLPNAGASMSPAAIRRAR